MARFARGFSLLEIMIVVFLIGLGASFVMPRLTRRKPNAEWSSVEQALNNMLYFARQESITDQKTYRIVCDSKKNTMHVESVEVDPETGKDKYEKATSYYFTAEYEFPDSIRMITAQRGKKELFKENKKGHAYCYVVPRGLVQDMKLTLQRVDEGKTSTVAMTVEPFLGSFFREEVKPK